MSAPAAAATRPRASIRVDLQVIADMVKPGTRVLDIGCGDGALLDYLVHFKQVDGRGIELSQAGVNACGNGARTAGFLSSTTCFSSSTGRLKKPSCMPIRTNAATPAAKQMPTVFMTGPWLEPLTVACLEQT